MAKFFFAQIILLFVGINVYGQAIQPFELTTPAEKISNSLYSKIKLLDARPDTTSYGMVYIGAFNRKAKVVVKAPLSAQLAGVMDLLGVSGLDKGTLLLQLHQFNFAEITETMSEKGFFSLRANLYSAKGDQYQKLSSIDTVLIIKSKDVTKGLLNKGSESLIGFIKGNLLKDASGPVYNYHDVINVDSVEKSNIKVYTAAKYTDGMYTTYKAFMNQTPDKQITVLNDDVSPEGVKALDDKGKLKPVPSKTIFAIVYKGQPYVVSETEYCPLIKKGSDFFFTGNAIVSANTGDVVAASMPFGVVGGKMAANYESRFEMQLDHKNGGFIRLKEVKTKPASEY